MRHGDKIKNLSRTKAHRDALLGNLSSQLIKHKRIVTTLAKAKALRVFVEPLITKSKDNTTHQRRIVFSHLQDKEAVTVLFNEVATKVAGRPGGYTRIIKLGTRPGDAAEKALIELVDYNEIYGKGVGDAKAGKRSRRRSGSRKKSETEGTVSEATPVAQEAQVVADEAAKSEKVAPAAEKTDTEGGEKNS